MNIKLQCANSSPPAVLRGGSRRFFRRGCTRLLLYFNTNKPHRFFLLNTSCIRKPQVISWEGGGVHTPCTLPLDPPLLLMGTMLCILTSFTEVPCSVRTAFTPETFPEDVTGLVTRSSIKARLFFAAAVLTVNEGTSRLKKKKNNWKFSDPMSRNRYKT